MYPFSLVVSSISLGYGFSITYITKYISFLPLFFANNFGILAKKLCSSLNIISYSTALLLIYGPPTILLLLLLLFVLAVNGLCIDVVYVHNVPLSSFIKFSPSYKANVTTKWPVATWPFTPFNTTDNPTFGKPDATDVLNVSFTGFFYFSFILLFSLSIIVSSYAVLLTVAVNSVLSGSTYNYV